MKIVPILLPKSLKENELQKFEGQIKRHMKYHHNPIFQYFRRQTNLQRFMRVVAFLQHIAFSLKRHKTLLHNLEERKHSNVKIVAALFTLYMPDMFQSITQLKMDGSSSNFDH